MRSEGYSTVCLSVTTLGATSFIDRFKVRYQRLMLDILKVFNSWISPQIFCLKVMVLFAYCDEPRHFLQTVDVQG